MNTQKWANPRYVPFIVFLAVTGIFWLIRPVVVSGDGVGYIKRLVSPERDIVPGHLIYIPMLDWLRNLLSPEGGHSQAAMIATFVSIIGGALACSIVCALTIRITKKVWPALLASLGMAVSYGFYRASGDVEAYSISVALLAAMAALLMFLDKDQPFTWRRAIFAGFLLGLTTLFHTSLVLITPFVAWAAYRSSKNIGKSVAVVAIGGAFSAASFLFVSMGILNLGVSESIAWIMTSDNGYAQPPAFSLAFIFNNLGRLFYGVCRTFIHSPAPDRLGIQASVHLTTIGIGFLIAFAFYVVVGIIGTPKNIRKQLRILWVWVVPLLFFGFLFFPAATERWVFILPCIWITAGVAAQFFKWKKVALVGATALVLVPAITNVTTVREERKLDRRTLARSEAISEILNEGDLLLYPGHTWDEYIGFYEDVPVERFILASFAGEEQGDRSAVLERLRNRLDATYERNGRVIAVRVFDPPESHHGWSLLRALGVPRDDVLCLLSDYEAHKIVDDPVGVWEIRRSAEIRVD